MNRTLPFDVHGEVVAAAARLRGMLIETPLVGALSLSRAVGAEVRYKLENVQVTGSFKARGALNRMLCLSPAERSRGVVAASSGNHGLGVANAAQLLGCQAQVFVPETTPLQKRQAIAHSGALVVVFGNDCVDTEGRARSEAEQSGRPYISPYNDPLVVAGQGTIAEELLRQWPEVEVVYVAMGGGGLLSGMAGYGKRVRPEVEWVACSPSQSPAMEECVRMGRIVDVPCGETWSDSTHGGVEPGAITLPLCEQLVDRWLQCDEAAIEAALRGALAQQHLLVEGAAAVAIACCQADLELRARRACVLICGGNLPYEKLQRIVASGAAQGSDGYR
ncbi:MAG: pyridoxal-phosphate dependent enzyme [Planctomycetota bacterium]|jgi:threonine dehydratase|nr:pyridoxal-phosphate dependent enzyme [Planctomycetota bacterium]MSR37329.1 pyridoxal-phosphate dependent enzyme [Planctomycetota bacterium]